MIKIEYLASDGKTPLKIEVSEYLDRAVATSYIGGKYDFCGHPSLARPDGPAGVIGSIGRIGLQQPRYDEVMSAINALQAQIDARPDVQLRKLIAQRAQLARQIGYVLDARHEERQNRIERASASGVYRAESRDYTADETAARKALADFDVAHPDVVAKIKADKETDIKRFLTND